MLRHLDHARRPRERCSVTVPSPTIDETVFFLHSHAVTLSAADGVNATSPMEVGRALEGLLSVPVHSLRVTAHHPEHYFVIFTQPSHQVNTIRRGSIRVEGASFKIASWHEHDHATFDSLLLHVHVVIERVSMQFWSVDGAEEILGKRVHVDRLDSRTLERGTPKLSPIGFGRATLPTSLLRILWRCYRAARGGWKRWRVPPLDRRVAPPTPPPGRWRITPC
ncbi:D-3-phosphoglycerate dehydrogenase, chloroplastic [Hordeum vulgare]|nr:D-3-phosphoglycerate dehydrogenase, chloroplastic [Hordeum vulgare]